MSELKLPKLPDRTPIKMSLTINADLNRALHAYAERYAQVYGTKEPLSELIPFMLEVFLMSESHPSKRQRRVNTATSTAGK